MGTVTSYDDAAVTNGTTYYYRVTAVNAVGESAPSNEVAATPQPPQLPGAPVLSSGSSAITGYRIYRSTGSGAETFLTSVGTVTSYKDTATTRGVVYYYKVTAVSAVGEGPASNEASAKAS